MCVGASSTSKLDALFNFSPANLSPAEGGGSVCTVVGNGVHEGGRLMGGNMNTPQMLPAGVEDLASETMDAESAPPGLWICPKHSETHRGCS